MNKAQNNENKIFGFWIYLMSDCIVFATLFIVYFVINRHNIYYPNGKDIFNIDLVLTETLILLLSSFSYSMSNLYFEDKKIKVFNIMSIFTLSLGILFIFIEFYEFYSLFLEGLTPSKSAFLSIFFTLIGTHGLHILFGTLWLSIMIIHVNRRGFINENIINLKCLGLFWHFLDIIWIFIFTFIYLFGII